MSFNRLFPALLLLLLPLILGQSAPDDNLRIADAAMKQVGVTLTYDPEYVRLAYPMGDIDPAKGVCTDVVIRAFRAIGVDLQKEIHEDMTADFSAYPGLWGLKKPDSNIDHRRVQNIQRYLERKGKSLPKNGEYLPGDVVAWRLFSGVAHIGVVSTELASPSRKRYRVVHNIGWGTRNEDVLYDWKIIGHYRWKKVEG